MVTKLVPFQTLNWLGVTLVSSQADRPAMNPPAGVGGWLTLARPVMKSPLAAAP